MTEIATLLARVSPGFFQQAFVVADLEAAQRAMTPTLVATPFVTLPPAMLRYRYRGRDVECALALGFARSGNTQIELLQPVEGEGIHAEFLDESGPGAHHLGFMVDQLDDEVSRATDWGFPETQGGSTL